MLSNELCDWFGGVAQSTGAPLFSYGEYPPENTLFASNDPFTVTPAILLHPRIMQFHIDVNPHSCFFFPQH